MLSPHYKLLASQVVIHTICIAGMIVLWDPQWLWASVLGTLLIGSYGLGIYGHRYLSHRSFKFYPKLEPFLNLLAIMALQGPPMTWAANHVSHHRYSDKDGDPHPGANRLKTWFWLGLGERLKADVGTIRRLSKVKMHKLSTDHYFKIYWSIIALSAIIDPRITVYFFAFAVVYTFHTSSFTNVVLHGVGYRNFDTPDNSRNLPIPVFLESNYHNNHHHDPSNYNQAVKRYEFDFYKYLIDLIKI